MGEREGLELEQADLLNEQGVTDAVHSAAFGPGGLRAVVNLVGGYAAGARAARDRLEDFERCSASTLRPTFLVTRAAVPFMLDKGGGSIVCVSARAAVQPFGGAVGYVRRRRPCSRSRRPWPPTTATRECAATPSCRAWSTRPRTGRRNPTPTTPAGSRPPRSPRVIRFLCSEESAPVSGAAVPGLRPRVDGLAAAALQRAAHRGRVCGQRLVQLAGRPAARRASRAWWRGCAIAAPCAPALPRTCSSSDGSANATTRSASTRAPRADRRDAGSRRRPGPRCTGRCAARAT